MRRWEIAALCLLSLAPAASAQPLTSLERGYQLMYGLEFVGAGREFQQWRSDHPRDPLGPLSEAANVLFAELDRVGILQIEFCVDGNSSSMSRPGAVAPDLRPRFEAKLTDAETLARSRLSEDGRDPDALFVLAMINGLRADYALLVERRRIAALSYLREATRGAHELLEVAPDYADAYFATGVYHWIVGGQAAPVRAALRAAGFSADKATGMSELRLAADRGRLLAPFARILLTMAHVRDKDTADARLLLIALRREFPSNTLFSRELEHLAGKGN